MNTMRILQYLKSKKRLISIVGIIILIYLIPYGILSYHYFLEIKPTVDIEINSFEKNLSKIEDPLLKIKEIANYSADNYYQTYGNETNPYFNIAILWGLQIFGDVKNPRIKSLFLFHNDPYFIIFYKTGACMESATIFNFIANKSGFESRTVGTKAEDHQWNEIKIENTWVHVDPTIYYHYYHDPRNNSEFQDLWFDNPDAYNKLGWYGGYSRVFIINTNEDLTEKYCNTSILTIYCQNCDQIRIKADLGKTHSIDQKLNNSPTTFILGSKNYSVTVEKDIIPFLLVKENNSNIDLIRNKNLSITLVPEEIKPTIYSSVIIILIFIGILIYDFKQAIKIYKDWKQKRD
jgi:hypothetical protein